MSNYRVRGITEINIRSSRAKPRPFLACARRGVSTSLDTNGNVGPAMSTYRVQGATGECEVVIGLEERAGVTARPEAWW
jgi:hypothetical protein